MKINAACGLDYRPGYLNIDGFEDAVADRIMPLCRIDLPDECADELLARQALEHLGFFRTKHFLAESFRLLKPGATLILETPDIETSFARFAGQDRAGREKLAQWIFGLETGGMAHPFCFPRELLEETVAAAGFSPTELVRFETPDGQPALRLSARRNAAAPALLFMAELRRELLAAGLCPFTEEPACAAREELFAEMQSALEAYYSGKTTGPLADCMIFSLENAELVRRFFMTLAAREILPRKYAACAAGLADKRFRAELLLRITGAPLEPDRQAAGLACARSLVRAAAAGLLTGGDISDYLPAAPRPGSLPECDLSALDERTLQNRSMRTCAKAVKLVHTGNPADAQHLLTSALALFRQNFRAWWNLARLARLTGDTRLADSCFDRALQCLALNPGLDRTGSTAKNILLDRTGKCITCLDGVFTVKSKEETLK
ncbi:MAG: hypothetical protein PHW69_02835 [Elusimicrobiaceae bacterium]|nr:hypothetical protein [Elusimicrobiaceae bacterium]